MTAITVLKDNVPQGPFTRAEVAERLARGETTLDALAFVEGLKAWTPLREVLARVDAMSAPAPAPAPAAPPVAAMPIGTGYGATGPASGGAAAPIGTGYSYAATMQPPTHLVYAGFWLRAGAIVIDGLILCPLTIISYFLGAVMDSTTNNGLKLLFALVCLGYAILALAAQWLYFSLQESSRHQATLGKRLLGIQVTDRQGGRIGFGRATGRYFGKILSGLILYIGFMMAGWTQRKQALHDMLADTLVVRKPLA